MTIENQAENAASRALASRRSNRRSMPSPGFTLIEMVGVLAVVMILATVVFSTTVKQMSLVAGQQERATLQTHATALQNSILRNRYIPAATNWAQIVATELGAAVGTVSTNPGRQLRLLVIDPQLQIGGNGGGLPYLQTITGSVVTNASGFVIPPVGPRLVILSSLGPALPGAFAGGPVSSNDFNAIWNAADGTVPSGPSWTGWKGRDDLQVQRINLSPLFVHVLLNNHSSPGPGRYVIDGLATNTVPSAGVNAFFLRNSVLGLFTHTGTLDSQQVLARGCTYVYDSGVWRNSITQSPLITSASVELVADRFSISPWNRNAGGPPDTQATVLSAMDAFMNAYAAWAALGTWPHGADPTYKALGDAQNALKAATQNLMVNPQQGNCQ